MILLTNIEAGLLLGLGLFFFASDIALIIITYKEWKQWQEQYKREMKK